MPENSGSLSGTRLLSLTLRNWRNIEEMTFHPGTGVNVIRGENAQGKTNLIEAIWSLSGAHSFRGAKDSQFIRFGSARAEISASFFFEGRVQEMDLAFSPRRSMQRNGIACRNDDALLPMVVFSPAHLSLVRDGPAQRRRFLDDAIGRLYPSYEQNLTYYARALQQRNTLLKDAYSQPALRELLDVWDQNLARAGAQIIRLRRRYVDRIRDAADAAYAGISSGREKMDVRYVSSVSCEREEDLRDVFLETLAGTRAEDLRLGQTTCGAHRDDLELTVNELDARQFGSQGQQRSCVLALKLAECSVLETITGEGPIILLDDVLSELDAQRRDYLLHHIQGRQVFLTCCEDVKLEEEVSRFTMCAGRLV